MTKRNHSSGPTRQFPSKSPSSPALSAVDILFQKAVGHLQAGQFAPAEALFRQILQVAPRHSDALHLLGVIAYQVGKYPVALELMDKAIQSNPHNADAYSNRGSVLYALHQYEAALESCDKAIQLRPDFVEAHNNRSNALKELHQYQMAVESCDKAIRLRPGTAEAHRNRGNALNRLHQYEAAVESCNEAIRLRPNYAEAFIDRGNAFSGLHRYELALESLDRAILIDPGNAEAYANRGNVFYHIRQYQAALESCEKAILLNPDFVEAYCIRSNALLKLHQVQAALQSCDKAILLNPNFAEAYCIRSNALFEINQLQEALQSCDKAILLNPEFAIAYSNRGNVLFATCQYEEALQSLDQAIHLKPDFAAAHYVRSSALYELRRYEEALQSLDQVFFHDPDYEYLPGKLIYLKRCFCSWADIEDQCRQLEARIDLGKKVIIPFETLAICDSAALQKKAAEIYVQDKYPSRCDVAMIPRHPRHEKIRIGYYSADFREHAVSYLMAELFERHDKSKFEILGFSFGPDTKDPMQLRVSAAMDKFLDVRSVTDQDVVRLSRELEVDIAVDLMGFTKNNRTAIFAERAAPIQINYLGFPGTMGASYMDYIIADRTLVPTENQRHYAEKIVYLPDCFQANNSQKMISNKPRSRADEGLPDDGFVYCCFNNNYKLSPGTFDLWMRILGRVEGSVLWMLGESPWECANLRSEMEQRGISAERLIFAGRIPLDEHIARQRLADLFLDTFPFNAGTTASLALSAGLPVLTHMGAPFASRMAGSLLRAVGLPDLVTTTEEDYETLAVETALDAERYRAIRERLQQNLLTSPLFDACSFTRHMEAAYGAMYERCHMDLPPDHLYIPHSNPGREDE